jgi:hypothetical protein
MPTPLPTTAVLSTSYPAVRHDHRVQHAKQHDCDRGDSVPQSVTPRCCAIIKEKDLQACRPSCSTASLKGQVSQPQDIPIYALVLPCPKHKPRETPAPPAYLSAHHSSSSQPTCWTVLAATPDCACCYVHATTAGCPSCRLGSNTAAEPIGFGKKVGRQAAQLQQVHPLAVALCHGLVCCKLPCPCACCKQSRNSRQ